MSREAFRQAAVAAPDGYGFPTDPGSFLSWSSMETALLASRTYWLGTTSPDRRPYATPLWAVWVDGALYFDGNPITRWARNLQANPEINVHLEHDGLAVILDGTVEDLPTTDADLGARIVGTWTTKYGHGAPLPVERGLFRLRPRRIRAWSESLSDGTRWELETRDGPDTAPSESRA